MSKEHLSIYLNDHLAGANVALEILDHLASEASDWSALLAALKTEIAEDQEQLRAVMARHEIEESRVRKAGGWLAEFLAEFKLEVDDDSEGPLRRLERLEALAIGIEGKIALWGALHAAAGGDQKEMDYERLTQRGRDQRTRVEALRLAAAREALAA